MKKILIIVAIVVLVGVVWYGVANYLYLSSLQHASDYARQAGAKAERKHMMNVLALYYDKNNKLPQNIDEYITFDSAMSGVTDVSLRPVVSYRLVDKKHAELCYLVPVEIDDEAPCLTYTQP